MANKKQGQLVRSASVLALLAGLTAQTATAQELNGVVELEPIIVTGEKVERNVLDTASSVEVYSGAEIEAQAVGKADVQTVIAGTPNVHYSENVSTPIIRGQSSEGPHTGANAFFGGTVPRATINLDGHYLDYNEFYFGATSAWDVSSIEVFRGPQTTSQGANAIAGAIIVNTNDPTFEKEGAYRLEFGNYNQRRASLMWNAPLSDQLAARIALDYSGRDTFINYIGSTFVQNEIGQDFESLNGRLKFLLQPVDLPGFEAKLTLSHTDTLRPSSEGSSEPYDDLNSITTWMPGWDQTTDTAILDASYDFANGFALSNQLQATWQDIDRRVGTPTMGDADIERQSWSNETKLSFGDANSDVSGFAGIYFAHTTQDDWLNQGGISTFEDERENLGIYGEVTWRMADRWTLTGGLRYQRDEVTRTGTVSPVFANSDLDYSETFEEILPKLSLAYEVSPELTIGGLISKGYNPGGVSLDFVSSKEWEAYEAETVWNYELFARAQLLDDRLALVGNLFYMDFDNAQHSIMQNIGGTTYIHTINADEASSYGLELSLDYRPSASLQLNAGLGLLKTELSEFSAAPGYEGNEFARAPGTMLSLGGKWDVTDKFSLGGQARYVSGYYSDTANSAAYEIDGYTLVDLNVSYALSDRIDLYGYVNNLLDERTPTLKQAARGSTAFTQASMTSPRMVGIGIRGTF
ncbi:TonB-dependent receptor [Rhodobacteraceae bacterium G21628-S1]|nr:TonB-dependent receptor [Rhodobacteraceae bacterium G21628-S1]